MNTTMLFTGNYPQQFNDSLSNISLFDLYMLIAEPSKNLITKIENLQNAKALGPDAYRNLKSKLPYFIGAKFKNNIRKPGEIESINWFTLDLDHILKSIGDEEQIKSKLSKDKRIALMFTSPGGEGLKIVFKLKKALFNTLQYSNFYTAFASEFAKHYELEKYVDFKTKDAARICFLSIDPKAYINEACLEVDPEKYISKYDLFHQTETKLSSNEDKKELNEQTYTDILKKLNPKTPKKQKIYLVPDVLKSVMAPIENKARKMGLQITHIKDISYGQQITFAIQQTISIINLFYGKKGFTIHITNKGQSDEKFGQVCKALIEDVIYSNQHIYEPLDAKDQIILQSKINESSLNN
jgi:hypothetical protein